MRTGAVEKINKIGKAGSIIALILKILLGIGFVGCLIGFIAVMVLPQDFLKVKVDGTADVRVNLATLGIEVPEDDLKESVMKDIGNGGTISFDNNELSVTDVETSDSGFHILADGQFTEFTLRSCAYAIFAGMIYVGMSFVTVLFAGFLAKAFAKCRSPFDEDIIKKMKNFAFSLIPWTVISGITNAAMANIFSGRNANFNLSVNLSYIFIVLIILALAYIFQYGAELQRESDETI